ncbi:MAG: winged helix-turn-helix transcriptional regulator [Candidatus Bathyarchaeota archaeon]|nr:MAG: winged helix-turn-helix transcriptional regulator [Candidatus Bathyarchaeota archaeon]
MKQSLSETCYKFFSTLANPTRLAIVELLRDSPRNVTEISQILNQEQSMISHNLQRLDECRFIFSEQRKKKRFYSLNKETMEPLLKLFTYHSEKYCPTGGKCLNKNNLQKRKLREASDPLYLAHQ